MFSFFSRTKRRLLADVMFFKTPSHRTKILHDYNLCCNVYSIIGRLSFKGFQRENFDLLLIGSIVALALSETSSAMKSLVNRELLLSGYQQSQIESDLPAKSMSLQNRKKAIILGQKSLWQWSFVNNKLLKINISNDIGKTSKLKHLVQIRNDILVSNNKTLHKISQKPLKVMQFNLDGLKENHSDEKSIALSLGSELDAYWIRSNSIWRFDNKENTLNLIGNHPTIRKKDLIKYDQRKNRLWIARGNTVLFYDYTKSKGSALAKALALLLPIRKIDVTQAGIILTTLQTVLLLNSEGKIKKTIPVTNNRKLILADFTSEGHSYLFNDRYIELHPLHEKVPVFSRLSLGRVRKAENIRTHKNILAMILDGHPRIFQFEGEW